MDEVSIKITDRLLSGFDKPQNKVVVDKDMVSSLGLTNQDVGSSLSAALGGGFFYELVNVGDLGTGGVCDVRCALRENVIFAFRDAVGADDDLRALRHILGTLSDRQAAAAQL